ncbi:hypothetical protein [Alcanivorax sp. 24]|uniref:hypothetical protein n=1 Tax=Alcanivorax sp. 24 TaxID=2545266 RepID=UPI0010615BC2|nr:hypothetical protein [Alcanivorax sp. 24]
MEADVGFILNTMRDPAGIPAPPWLFQVLMVLTWVAHIAFVLVTLGAAALSIVAFYLRHHHPHWQQLSIAMTKGAKIGVSLLIVLGVAPLLFTQVIYDPQWYTASVLSARWLIIFIFTLIIGYCSWFVFYYSNKPEAQTRLGLFALLGLGLFLLDGLIMHVLAYQSLQPDQWMNWYAPNGQVDTRGASLHAIQWSRFLFIISLSAPALALYLLAYADYYSRRSDRPKDYRDFVRQLGRRIGKVGCLISLPLLFWWLLDLPGHLSTSAHTPGWLLAGALIILAIQIDRLGSLPGRGYLLLFSGLIPLGLMALWREVIRVHAMKPFGYDIHDYTVHADLPSTILFFLTLLGIGGIFGGFLVLLLYRAGQVEGKYQADRTIARLGTLSVVVLGLWITVFFVYGFSIWVRHAIGF